jgi:FkbM family methyltransferase
MIVRARKAFDDVARWTGRKSGMGKKLVKVAHRFYLMGSGFSYEMSVNGEKHLVNKVLASSPRDQKFVSFDVGAHSGIWTDLVRQTELTSSESHLFEPTSHLFHKLASKYGSDANVFVNQLGLGDIDGNREFLQYADSGSTVNSLVTEHNYHSTDLDSGTVTYVPVSKGDTYCSQRDVDQIDFLKIDVEGGEMLVLGGFDKMLLNHNVSVIQFEYGYANGDEGTLMRDFYRFWESKGYRVGVLRRDGVAFQPFSYPLNNFDSGPNFVAALPDFVEMLQHFD